MARYPHGMDFTGFSLSLLQLNVIYTCFVPIYDLQNVYSNFVVSLFYFLLQD